MLNAAARSLRRPTVQLARLSHINQGARRTLLTLKEVSYQVTATASGEGRNGPVESEGFKLNMTLPTAGKSKDAQNPEQLLAMGYASCFLLACQRIAEKQNKPDQMAGVKVHATVFIGPPNEVPGYALAADIKVEGCDEEVMKGAHEICPYSRVFKLGGVVNVSKV